MKQKNSETTTKTKNQILQWVNLTLGATQTKIQSFGNGVIYCLLINNYYPNTISLNKMILVPKTNMDNKTNLKKLQQALTALHIKTITFDIFRVSQMSYIDNWQLINKFYKYFQHINKNQAQEYQNIIINKQNQHPISQTPYQINLQPHNNFNSSRQTLKTPEFLTGLMTPMKGLKFFEENTKLRYQSLKLMQEIKIIVKSQSQSDKIKVKNLKKMLGLIDQESIEQQLEMKELFGDCKQIQDVIIID